MRVDDQYPSTSDMPPIAGAQEDHTLAIMETAMSRVERSWTNEYYIEHDWGDNSESWVPAVCGLGAIMAAEGLTEEPTVEVWFESTATAAAKEAIELLNAAATRLFPEIVEAGLKVPLWNGPLEIINQNHVSDNPQQDVLACYRDAIARRKGEVL